MKRCLFVLFVFLQTTMTSYCQLKSEKTYLAKYDVSQLLAGAPERDAVWFWNTIGRNNPRSVAIDKGFVKRNQLLCEIYQELCEQAYKMQKYDVVVEGMDSLSYILAVNLGVDNTIAKSHPIRIVADNSINASMDAIGQMRVCFGLINFDAEYEEVLAVCAHEAAHYFCQHVLSKLWSKAKKEKRNRAWAEVATALTIGAAAATSAYGISNGIEMKNANSVIANSANILDYAYEQADVATMFYGYRYSRDEEVEADIIAYRFMEYMGYGGEHVISMLRKLSHQAPQETTTKTDNHPDLDFRIKVLTNLFNADFVKKSKMAPSNGE